MKHIFICILFLLLLFSGKRVIAQPNYQYPVSFYNPFGTGNPPLASDFFADSKFVDDPNYPVSIPATGSKKVDFTVYLYRAINSTSGKKGYVDVFLGNTASGGNPVLAQKPLTTSNGNSVTDHPKTDGLLWQRIGTSSYERLILHGSFYVSASDITPQNGFNAFYAVFYDSQVTPVIQVERSHPIYLRVDGYTPPSNPSSNLQVYSITPAQGKAGTTTYVDVVTNFSLVPAGYGYTNYYIEISGTTYTPANITNVGVYTYRIPLKISGGASVGTHTVYIRMDDASGIHRYPTNVTFTITPAQITDFIPCGGNVICSNQCVPYGVVPQRLNGRLLADDDSDLFKTYLEFVSSRNESAWARGSEYEWVQWQMSFDNNNWYDINGATEQNFQPGPCYQKTYYRRNSTHLESGFFGRSREDWYTSEVVTITPTPANPIQANPYTTCGSFPYTVAVNPVQNAVSYNWYSVDPTWDVNGQGRFQNNTGASVQITPPANVAAGTYTFNVVANGECSQSFGTVSITVDPSFTTPAPITADFVDVSASKQCYSIYNLTTPVLNGVTSYSATLSSTGQTLSGTVSSVGGVPTVTFPFRVTPMPIQYAVSAIINVSGPCGTASYTTPDYDLENFHTNCSGRAASSDILSVYPNPASDQVILQAGGQEVEVAFYDAQGECRKTVKLKEQNAETAVNLLDLPAGTYHLRVVSDGKVVMQKQLIINH